MMNKSLFLPIGVTIVYNGNHSDGTHYRDIVSNKVIQEVENFELGAIYEIGRLLIKTYMSFWVSKLYRIKLSRVQYTFEGFIATIYLNFKVKQEAPNHEKLLTQAPVFKHTFLPR